MKSNDPFTFPKELYLDRFLLENKSNIKNLKSENQKRKTKVKNIEQEIAKIQSELPKALDLVGHFLDERIEEMNDDFVEVNSDTSIDNIESPVDLQTLEETSKLLKHFKEKLLSRIDELENKKLILKVNFISQNI